MAATQAFALMQTEDPKRKFQTCTERTTFGSSDSGQGTRWIFWMSTKLISKLSMTIYGSLRIFDTFDVDTSISAAQYKIAIVETHK